jgi:UDP:flavonoid glycosyltransferase YjiC (YdhE family)
MFVKFALASYGTRGDIEPSAAVGLELLRRGHDVHMAVPPELVSFVESAGLAAVPYGPKVQEFLDEEFLRNMWTDFVRNPIRQVLKVWDPLTKYWGDVSATLKPLADGADLLSTGLNFEQAAANVAEHYDIPLASLHHFPMRANGRLVPSLPAPLVRSTMTAIEWLFWQSTREVDNAQRAELGLPKATRRSQRRIAERRSLEIQAYDEIFFPGLAAEWARWGDRRPFVGALTMELPTDADDDVASWIASGTPPICFGSGSIALESAADTVRMIASACARLGERALICFGGTDFSDVPQFDHVKAVGPVNYATIFPACRAIVHHGGSGTTAASLRAGIPTLALWSSADQPYWAASIKRLKLGTARRFSATSEETLFADLRQILAPDYVLRTHEFAARMTKPAASIERTADLFEDAARRKVST